MNRSLEVALTVVAASLVSVVSLGACSSSNTTTSGGIEDDAAAADAGAETGTGSQCQAAKEKGLLPVAKVSTGEVKVLSEAGGAKTIFVDASAGGTAAAATNPRVYIDLSTITRVDVSDVAAEKSTDWDLAVERPILFSNSGDGGPGAGGAVLVAKSFDAVTAADAAAATFAPESFFDADCTMKVDPTNAVKTSFDGWYDYDGATMHLTPKKVTFLIKGGKGALFKLEILSYYANPDGTEGQAGGRYTFRVAPL